MGTMIEQAVIVYSKPNCVQCNATYRALDAKGFVKGTDYVIVDLAAEENAGALEYVKDLGYSQAPVVVVDDEDHWSGFQPAEIDRIAQALSREQ